MDEWQRAKVEKLRSACGCVEGFVGMLCAVTAYWAFSAWFSPQPRDLKYRLLIVLALGLLGAIAGKILGITVARFRLRRLLQS